MRDQRPRARYQIKRHGGAWYVIGYCGHFRGRSRWMPISDPLTSYRAAVAYMKRQQWADADAQRNLEI